MVFPCKRRYYLSSAVTLPQVFLDSLETPALKVFKQRFRTPDLVMLSEKIEQYASIPGMQVCRRRVLTPRKDRELLKEYRELTYAVLMPWIEGSTWMETLLGEESFTPEQSLDLAHNLATLLLDLEQRRLAHCDLSGANLMLTPQGEIELVDVEGLYAPELSKPEILPAGSPGYAHQTAPKGLWSPQADRFAGAVMLAEVLTFCDARIREASWGESYFNPRALQQEGEAYDLMRRVLAERWGDEIAQLFTSAWQSVTPAECPTLGEWHVALPDEVPEIVLPVPEEDPEPLESEPLPEEDQEDNQVEEQETQDIEEETEEVVEEPCPFCGKNYPIAQIACPYC